MRLFLTFVLLHFCLFLFPKSKTVDSLSQELKIAKHDTLKCALLFQLSEYAEDGEWEKYNEQLKHLTEAKLKAINLPQREYKIYQKYYAISLSNIGYIYKNQGENSKAFEYYNRGLKIQEEIGDKDGMANSFINIGYVYENQGDISKALDCYNKSLKLSKEIGDKEKMASSLNNMGLIYANQENFARALEYYNKSLKIREEIGDKEGIAYSLNCIGHTYYMQEVFEKSLDYFEKSLKIFDEIQHKIGIVYSLNGIGSVLNKQNELEKALIYLNKGLKICEEIGDKKGIAYSLYSIGGVCFKQKNYPKAVEYMNKSKILSEELGFPENIRNATGQLHQIYTAMGNYKLALENYKLFITMRDSINNITTQKITIQQHAKSEYEQKKAVEDAKHEVLMQQQSEKAAAEKNKQNIIIGSVSVVLFVVLIFSVFLYNRFKITQKQKAVIELQEKETQIQKHLIEEKHREITDSINYAERIQRSFLATDEILNSNLNDFFLFFKPKDIVSGDFYWASKLDNGNFAFVVADSTGHGVPGAIMSLLNITSLEKAIEHYTNPAEILNHTRLNIVERLKKDGSPEGGKDGMDCSLLVFDFENKTLQIASANNPVWIVRNNDLIEIKPDKMPVGKSDKQDIPFTLHTVSLHRGDTVYALTDGFPDQFGGPKGKKFMSKKLKELLVSNVDLPMPQQKGLLETAFKTWAGDLEQVDDVCVVGIRI